MLTQRALAEYLVSERKAHYLFTVKGNQPRLLEDIELFFHDRDQVQCQPDTIRKQIRINLNSNRQQMRILLALSSMDD